MKITQQQAYEYIRNAKAEVKRSDHTLRLGQALYNSLPKEIAGKINGTKNDFFYEVDDTVATLMFLENCVEV